MSTSSSRDDCVNEAGRGTSTLVGVPPAKASPMPSTMPPSSRTRSKRSMGSESSSISSANVTSPSSKFDKKKTKKKQRKEKKLTESHLKVRAAADVSRKWELDLEHVHGLTDEQACVVVLLMAPHLQKDEFPPSDDPLMLHAKEGWKYMKEVKRLVGLYPECLEDQTFMNGEWVML
jgi:hypothetical protein